MTAQRHAVLIGNDHFPDDSHKLSPLRCPVADVEGLEEQLGNQAKGGFSSVRVLKNETSSQVKLAIYETFRQAGSDDLVLIYYSGHGKQNAEGVLHLSTLDTRCDLLEPTSVDVGVLRQYAKNSKSNKIVFILDCCFSGAIAGAFAKGAVEDQLQMMRTEGRGTYIMTGSTGIQVSLEKEEDRYSVFTKYLIEGLKTGEADSSGDGTITIDEWYDYVNQRVRNDSPQQPSKWSFDVRGDLIIAKSGKVPRQERAKAIKRKLYRLAGEEQIPESLLEHARQIAQTEPSALNETEQRLDALLSQLLKDKLSIPQLIYQWGAEQRWQEAPLPTSPPPASKVSPLKSISTVEEPPSKEPKLDTVASPIRPDPAQRLDPEPRAAAPAAPADKPGGRGAGLAILLALVIAGALAYGLYLHDSQPSAVTEPPVAKPTPSPTATQPDHSAAMKEAFQAYQQQRYQEAYRRYQELAAQGNIKAQYNQAMMLNKGQGTEQDVTAAIHLLRPIATDEYPKYQYYLARIYVDHPTLDPNYRTTHRLLQSAAAGGNLFAQDLMGTLHRDGLGVPANLDEAQHWYQQAAQQGHRNAMVHLRDLLLQEPTAESQQQATYWQNQIEQLSSNNP
ncbi:caspase, EACC1-associated type [Ferrimonas marina]|uniref:Sel1 repeat-containing protein n=1 Tax=Ferrimonas marina TaxID=299255 RepID=A0A1M5X6G5_9GAMM|nr:caspase family protein [Ferrimonas marina]SHH94813.1 Sel1 repeat-containing protein [Ferrimonas marina]